MFTLEELFYHADIDDVTEDEEGTTIVFTMRDSRGQSSFQITGSDLEDALDQARHEVNRYNVMEGLRREGLTDDDIDRLAAGDVEEAWERGYIAGAHETSAFLTSERLTALPEFGPSDYHPIPAVSTPALAGAAEPVGSATLDQILAAPGALQALASGDGLAITLALIHPAKIVLS